MFRYLLTSLSVERKLHLSNISIEVNKSSCEMFKFCRVVAAPPLSWRQHQPTRRRSSMVSLMEADLPPAHDSLVTSSSTAEKSSLASGPSATPSPSSFVLKSKFLSNRDAFQYGDEHEGASSSHFSVNAPPSALEELAAQQTELRKAFEKQVSIRLQRRQPLIQAGPSQKSGQADKFVNVPLLPAAYLQSREVVGPDINAERLHNVIQRNALLQSSEKTQFRCLSCFHVFESRPSVKLLRPNGAPSTSWERAEVETERDAQARDNTRRSPRSIAKAAHPGRRMRQEGQCPTRCPMCRSNRVQWMMDYVQRKTVQRLTREDRPLFAPSSVLSK